MGSGFKGSPGSTGWRSARPGIHGAGVGINPHGPDPEELRKALGSAVVTAPRGRMKIFPGPCPGVGTTDRRLEVAQRESGSGRLVVDG